ncbi:hypothetical protein Q9233_011611 [Columba guinea]|nr:hypothetical protein Q9233_011611 [Columba guinea]
MLASETLPLHRHVNTPHLEALRPVVAILQHPFGFSLMILEFYTGYFGAWMCLLGIMTLCCQQPTQR